MNCSPQTGHIGTPGHDIDTDEVLWNDPGVNSEGKNFSLKNGLRSEFDSVTCLNKNFLIAILASKPA